jgi:hypothetical protein
MAKHRGPVWWVLYALVPLTGGLLMAEHHASLPPAWHTFVQIGIVLFIYGLIGLWLHANMIALLCADQDTPVRTYVYEAHQAALRSRRRPHNPRPARVSYARARQAAERLKTQTSLREMHRCSRN